MAARLNRDAVARRAVDSTVAVDNDTPAQQTVFSMLKDLTPQMARATGDAMTADRLARIALTEIRKTPALGECTPMSLAGALMTCAQLRLEPGPGGDAYLIPFRNSRTQSMEVQFVLGYKGMAELFWRHPLAQYIHADAVYEGDEWEYEQGIAPRLRHVPVDSEARAAADKEKVIAYYAAATLSTGGFRFVVMYPGEVERHRNRSNSPNSPAWRKDYVQMGKKTAVRAMFAMMPKSQDMVRAIAADESVRTDITPEALETVSATYDEHTVDAPDVPADADTAPPPDDAAGQTETAQAAPDLAAITAAAESKGYGEPDVADAVAAAYGGDRDPGSLSPAERARLAAAVADWQPRKPEGKRS